MREPQANVASDNASEWRDGSLRNHSWPRFLKGPDSTLLERLYVPALSEAVRYDRCCAYFSSSVLSAASRGFAGLIRRLVSLGPDAPKPAVRLIVNEELPEDDVRSLLETGDTSRLEEALLKRFKSPRDLLEKQRLEMLGWLVKSRLLAVRVGVMRQAQGIVHAKFGLMYDTAGDAVVFSGSGNETAQGLRANYERLEVSTSWEDAARFQEYSEEFEQLWNDRHPDVHSVTLPEAIEQRLIRFATAEPPLAEPGDQLERHKAAMLWRFIAEAPYLPNGASCCDVTAPLDSLWPHQTCVIEEATNAWPQGRLLCDEVGMGKTIEAIMILRRLMAGRGIQRALLLLPAGLTGQWQEELREKGGLLVPRLQGNDTLIWPDGTTKRVSCLAEALEENLLIMSRETARTDNNRATLLAARAWDLVLMDEAHAARRAKQEEGEFNSGTLLLELLRQLQVRGKARGFLLLSATPMQTSPWEPWDLLAVLGTGGGWLSDFDGVRAFYGVMHQLNRGAQVRAEDTRRAAWLVASDDEFPSPPDGFAVIRSCSDGERRLRFVPPSMKLSVVNWLRRGSPLARHMHRNTRRTIQEYFDRGLLSTRPPHRSVIDWPYDFQPPNGPERRLYDAVGKYIEKRFEELEQDRPGKGFVMTIYRRRAASSPFSLKKSLERRLEGLKRVMNRRVSSGYIEIIDAPTGMTDADLPEDIEPNKISASLPSSPEEARREAVEVEALLDQLKTIGTTDTKRDRFFDLIRSVVSEGRSVLIFTEYADTMEYLRDNLAAHYGSDVASYSGDGGAFYREGTWLSVTKKEITDALRDGKIRFLVCTDAASEGLNLQAASALINYDLPWNPSRVEQRIGRIDRIGQREQEVKIYNFFLKRSIDEQVYKALENRCGLFKHFVGAMQPVLARAKGMLHDPKTFSLEELEKIAADAQNELNEEVYIDSPALDLPEDTPSVTKADLRDAISAISAECGLQVKQGDIITIKGLGNKTAKVSMKSDALDSDAQIMPLTALSDMTLGIADVLIRPGEYLPFIVDSHRDGAFRCSCAVWVGPDGMEEVATYTDLKHRLESWDGSFPDVDRAAGARRYCVDHARRHVAEMRMKADRVIALSCERQREAVKIRTARELGRLVLCMEPDYAEITSALAAQVVREGLLADKIRDAKKMIGEDFNWFDYLDWELRQYVEELTANEKRSRLSGSSLDAALSDYRWG